MSLTDCFAIYMTWSFAGIGIAATAWFLGYASGILLRWSEHLFERGQ